MLGRLNDFIKILCYFIVRDCDLEGIKIDIDIIEFFIKKFFLNLVNFDIIYDLIGIV